MKIQKMMFLESELWQQQLPNCPLQIQLPPVWLDAAGQQAPGLAKSPDVSDNSTKIPAMAGAPADW